MPPKHANYLILTMVEIFKYSLPALIVLGATWLVLYKLLKDEREKRDFQLKKTSQKEITTIRLHAYERLALLLERTEPEHLLVDLDITAMDKMQLSQHLMQQVRMEYDHNLSQQIYVSDSLWEEILQARDAMLSFVPAMLMQTPKDATTMDFAKILITGYKTNGETANEKALRKLKGEVAALLA